MSEACEKQSSGRDIMKSFKYLQLIIILFFGISACGGGEKALLSSSSLFGSAQKGDYLAESTVSFLQLSENGIATSRQVDTKIKNNRGEYSLSIPWNNWTKITVTGLFFNEVTGRNSKVALAINNITDIGDSSGNVNINLFTHLVASRIQKLVNNAQSLTLAKKQSLKELKLLLGLGSGSVEKLNLGSDAQRDNAILLLFSAGFIFAVNDADKLPSALLSLSDDFADNGLFDGKGKAIFQEISSYAGKQDVFDTLSINLKKRGYKTPPTAKTLGMMPAWVRIDKSKNRLPIANAGKDLVISEGQVATLKGTGIDIDGQIKTYIWTQGEAVLSRKATLVLQNLVVGTHNYTLTVTDNKGAKNSDSVKITIKEKPKTNQSPIANAGADRTITEGQAVTLKGSGKDADGTIKSYLWTQGKAVLSRKATLLLQNLVIGTHNYTLTVTDNKGAKSSDSVIVTVKAKPLATIKVNLHEERCVTVYGMHLQLVSTVKGGVTGSGPLYITRYKKAKCLGGVTSLPSYIPSVTTATYVISNIVSIGSGMRTGTMTVTALSQSRSAKVNIDQNGNVSY
jgi:hypothetical protein